MSTTYCVRLYRYDPRVNYPLMTDPYTAAAYNPSTILAGWSANFSTADAFSEALVTFSDPVNGQVSNTTTISFRTGLPTEGDRDVTHVGLIDAGSLGATRNDRQAGAIPLAVIALPGGRHRMTAAGRFDVAPGALVFTLS